MLRDDFFAVRVKRLYCQDRFSQQQRDFDERVRREVMRLDASQMILIALQVAA